MLLQRYQRLFEYRPRNMEGLILQHIGPATLKIITNAAKTYVPQVLSLQTQPAEAVRLISTSSQHVTRKQLARLKEIIDIWLTKLKSNPASAKLFNIQLFDNPVS